MALISVILPCYNMVNYIDRCMETLVKQTIGIENLEIILVNDASTDNTLEKLQEWEVKYPENIMVITYEENMRQGGARNIGMQYATSEYIGFVDPDDYIELDMYESLYEVTKTKKYDMVCGKITKQRDIPKEQMMRERKDVEYEFEDMGGWYANNMKMDSDMGGVVTGIYRKANIIDNNLWFPERMAYEDNYWGAVHKLYIRSAYVVDKLIYHYCINDNSTTQKRNGQHHFDRLSIELAIIEKYKQLGAFEYYEKELEFDFIKRFYLNTLFVIFTKFDYIPNVFNYMRGKVMEIFPDYDKNPQMQLFLPIEQELLKLIKIEGDLTEQEIQMVKRAYLETIGWK